MTQNTCCTPSSSFFTEKLWIESVALDQWSACAQLPGIVKAMALPDLHPGRGVPIGCALVSHGFFYPHLAGNDLGCGVSAFKLSGVKKYSPDNLSNLKWMKNEPDFSLLDEHLERYKSLWTSQGFDYHNHFGTIGGGNHFAEIGMIESVEDNDYGLKKDDLILLVHSGSRTLGDNVARYWSAKYGVKCSDVDTVRGEEWWALQNACISWANCNRRAIAQNISTTLKASTHFLCDTVHNAIEKVPGASIGLNEYESVYIHRKGASDSKSDMVVLPGSRGDYSYLLKPYETEKSGFSLAHGAGRKWSRSECKGKLENRFTKESLRKTDLGSRVVCENPELLYEEAPQAYKKSSDVLNALVEHNLAKPIAKLKPLVSIKI